MSTRKVFDPQAGRGWTSQRRNEQRKRLTEVYNDHPELADTLREKMTALHSPGNEQGERVRRVLRLKGLARYDKLTAMITDGKLDEKDVALAKELGLYQDPGTPVEPAVNTARRPSAPKRTGPASAPTVKSKGRARKAQAA